MRHEIEKIYYEHVKMATTPFFSHACKTGMRSETNDGYAIKEDAHTWRFQ